MPKFPAPKEGDKPKDAPDMSAPKENAAPPPATPMAAAPGGQAKNKTPLIIAAVVIGALVLAGSIFAGFYLSKSETPYEVLEQTFENVEDATSVHAVTKASVKVTSEGIKDFSGFLSETPTDTVDINFDIDSTFTGIEGDAENQASDSTVTLELAIGTSKLSGSFDVRSANEAAYFRLTDVPDGYQMFVAPYMNKWIKVDYDEIEEALDPDSENDTDFSDAQLDKIFTLAKQLEEEGVVADESKGGEYIYTIKSTGKKLKEVVKAVDKIEGSEGSPFSKELDEIPDDAEFSMMISIGKKSHLPNQFDFGLSITVEEGGIPINVDVSSETTFDNFNKDVEITAPENAQTIDEIMAELYGGFMDDSMIEDGDAEFFEDEKDLFGGEPMTEEEIAEALGQ